MGGGEQKQTSYQKSDPWEPAQPALNAALGGAMDAYNNTYQGPQIAGMDPSVSKSFGIQEGNANSGFLGSLGKLASSNLGGILSNGGLSSEQSAAIPALQGILSKFNAGNDNATGYLTPYASGAMRGSNQYLDASIDNAMSDAATATNRQFSAAGRYGSGAQSDALGSRLGKIATDARMTAYENDSNRQLQAIQQLAGLNNDSLQGNLSGQNALSSLGQQRLTNSAGIASAVPTLDAATNIDAARLGKVGSAKMDYAQSLIDSANSAPWTRVGNLAQIAGGIGGLGGTQFGIQTKSNSGGMGGLGGVLGGLGMLGNLATGGALSGLGGMLSLGDIGGGAFGRMFGNTFGDGNW